MAQEPSHERCGEKRGTALPAESYLPMQKRENISPSKSSAVNSPVMDDSERCASRQLFRQQLQLISITPASSQVGRTFQMPVSFS